MTAEQLGNVVILLDTFLGGMLFMQLPYTMSMTVLQNSYARHQSFLIKESYGSC
jgi:hypothetical protein